MVKPHRWVPDQGVYCYGDFDTAVIAGRTLYVKGFFRDRPVHSRFVANMSYALVTQLINRACIRLAVQSPEYREWLRERVMRGRMSEKRLAELRAELIGSDPDEWIDADYEIVDEPVALLTGGGTR